MRLKSVFAAAALAIVTACGSDPALVAAPEPVRSAHVAIAYATVELRDVSLPDYATREEIVMGEPGGLLVSESDLLWADDPTRSVTLALARALTSITSARVAPEPWPFRDAPEVTVDVRMERFLPEASGGFTARGLYYVAAFEREGADHAHDFRITVPYDPEAGVAGIAAARSQAIAALAQDIASTALR